MTRMPTFEEIRQDFERGVRTAGQRIEHPFRHDGEPRTAPHAEAAQAARQAPAAQPVNLAPAPAAAPSKGTRMSLITDVEADYEAVKAKIAKLDQNLPAAIGVAKKLEGNPLVAVALKAAEHVAAGLIPPEALAYLAGQFGPALDGLLALYNPQGAAGAAPAQAQQIAPAQ
jgi:hypothetical protein